jgi:hypothetical protein
MRPSSRTGTGSFRTSSRDLKVVRDLKGVRVSELIAPTCRSHALTKLEPSRSWSHEPCPPAIGASETIILTFNFFQDDVALFQPNNYLLLLLLLLLLTEFRKAIHNQLHLL